MHPLDLSESLPGICSPKDADNDTAQVYLAKGLPRARLNSRTVICLLV